MIPVGSLLRHLRAFLHGTMLRLVALARRRPPVLLNAHLNSVLYSAAADCAGISLNFLHT